MNAPESLTALKPCVNRPGELFYTTALAIRAAVPLATQDLVLGDVLCEILQAKLPVITLIRERLK